MTGHVVVTEDLGVIFPELLTRGDTRSHALEVPGIRYRVARSQMLPSLPRSIARRLGFLGEEASDGKADGDEEVLAPTGEVFLFAEVVTESAVLLDQNLPTEDARGERLLLDGRPGGARSGPLQIGGTLSGALTVPEDPAPEAAALEVTCGDVTQTLSLVEGSRLSSDMEHWYAQWYRATAELSWWERVVQRAGNGPALAGAVSSVRVVPALLDGTWPQPGAMLLGIELAVLPAPVGTTAQYDLALILPDGAEAALRGAPVGEALADPGHPRSVWFEVPADLESAVARLSLGLRTADGEELDLGAEEIPVVIAAVER